LISAAFPDANLDGLQYGTQLQALFILNCYRFLLITPAFDRSVQSRRAARAPGKYCIFPSFFFFTVGSIFRAFGWILCRVQNLVFLVGLGRISAPLEEMRGRARPLDWSERWPTLKGVLEGCFSIRSVCFAVALFFLIRQGFHVLSVEKNIQKFRPNFCVPSTGGGR
jgi:hypothetical protein